MAVTGLALAGAVVGYMAYSWMQDPKYDKSPANVRKAATEVLSENNYTIDKTETSNKNNTHMFEASNRSSNNVDIAISPVDNNPDQAKVYIKGTKIKGVSKAQSQILLNKINSKPI